MLHVALYIVIDVSMESNASIFMVKKSKNVRFEADDEATN